MVGETHLESKIIYSDNMGNVNAPHVMTLLSVLIAGGSAGVVLHTGGSYGYAGRRLELCGQ